MEYKHFEIEMESLHHSIPVSVCWWSLIMGHYAYWLTKKDDHVELTIV